MSVSCVVVTHNSFAGAPEQMASLVALACSGFPDVSWIFVDNSPTSVDARRINEVSTGKDDVRVLERPDNPGFASAVNQAVLQSSAEWVLLVNPDVGLDGDVLARIVQFLSRSDLDAYALSMVTQGRWHCGIAEVGPGWFVDRRDPSSRLLGPSGGMGAYRRSTFIGLGGFDDTLFAWGEDAEFAFRLVANGIETGELDVCVPHIGGHSAGALPSRRRRAESLARNRQIVAARYLAPARFWGHVAFSLMVFVVKAPSHVRRRTLTAQSRGMVSGFRAGLAGRRISRGSGDSSGRR